MKRFLMISTRETVPARPAVIKTVGVVDLGDGRQLTMTSHCNTVSVVYKDAAGKNGILTVTNDSTHLLNPEIADYVKTFVEACQP